jgi:predicted 3-demethylubiquinone-9 3-methyltransferase (glyoxalase superfamily)
MAQKITPFLWFDGNAEEAAGFYVSVFKNSRIVKTMRSQGRVLTVEFDLDGQRLVALNGGPHFCRGRSFPRCWWRCWRTLTRRSRSGSCRPCCR